MGKTSHVEKGKVKDPTLTSKSATLGWGTLEISAGDQGLGLLDAFGWATRQLSSARMNEVCAALRFSLGCDSN